jgi:hypothetical protein
VGNFPLLECFALTPNAFGFFGVWIALRGVAAVGPVERLRVSAHAYFIEDHVTLAPSVHARRDTGNRVFALGIRCCFHVAVALLQASGCLVRKRQFHGARQVVDSSDLSA